MSTIADYAGRAVDLMAFQGATTAGPAPLQMAIGLPGNSGTVATGVQKLAQRFLLELLTERGSMPYAAKRGCNFMTRLRAGRLRTTVDVLVEFSLAISQVETNLLADERSDDPPDERFAGAELLDVALGNGTIRLQILLTTAAGRSRKFILPLGVLP